MRPCVVIPVYDHGDTARGVVASLERYGLPILLVDDGSHAPTRDVLDALARDVASLELVRHRANAGKGAALKTGYRTAAARGFSHVLQLDADGQHDADDVPRFLDAMAKHPEALVVARPLFDDSAPRLRVVGRQLSVGLVHLATLSTAIRDPLTGFRGIPLAATLRVIDAVATGDRMDFDPEIAVRLYWEGTPVVNLDSHVAYDPEGLSHFDVVWDDLRLASLYVRLAAGMLTRLPSLLARQRGA